MLAASWLAGCAWMGHTTVGTVPPAVAIAGVAPGATIGEVLRRLGTPVEYWLAPDGLLLIWREHRYDFDHVDLDPSLGLPLASLDPTIGSAVANLRLTLERGTLHEKRVAVLFDRQGRVVAVVHRNSDGGPLR